MQEQILKIIERDITQIGWDEVGNPTYNGFQHKAKEIADTFERFIRYCIEDAIIDDRDDIGYQYSIYQFGEGYKTFKNISELFSYWNEHINNEK